LKIEKNRKKKKDLSSEVEAELQADEEEEEVTLLLSVSDSIDSSSLSSRILDSSFSVLLFKLARILLVVSFEFPLLFNVKIIPLAS
jgi:hypothetical protein